MSRRTYVPPALTEYFPPAIVLEFSHDPPLSELERELDRRLLDALEKSDMHRTICGGCRCVLLTRSTAERCPICRTRN